MFRRNCPASSAWCRATNAAVESALANSVQAPLVGFHGSASIAAARALLPDVAVVEDEDHAAPEVVVRQERAGHEEATGQPFNAVLLNLYRDGRDSVVSTKAMTTQ